MHYDFLSNVPSQIKEKIESRAKNEIINWIDANDLISPLLADLETNNVGLNVICANTTIGHDSLVKGNILTSTDNKLSSSAQVSITEVDFIETEFTKSSVSINSSGEIDFTESNLPKNSMAKVSRFHAAIFSKDALVNSRSTEIGKTQISFPKLNPIEVGFAKVSPGVNTSSEAFVSKISSPKTLPSEILFSPSVEPEQFFSIHHSAPETIDELNNSATNSLGFSEQNIDPETLSSHKICKK